jgi:hypothetical protein
LKVENDSQNFTRTSLLRKYETKGFQFKDGEEGNYFESLQAFGEAQQKFDTFLSNSSEVKIFKPTTLYEIPR